MVTASTDEGQVTREFFTIRHDSGLTLTSDDVILLGNQEGGGLAGSSSDVTDQEEDDVSWSFKLFDMKQEQDYSA